MSLYSYYESKKIAKVDYNFDALIMAALRKADSFNTTKLRLAFPEIFEEFFKRYNSPAGVIDNEDLHKGLDLMKQMGV